jgi:D-glycero-D-manno-heptose 1,7-bisphosphate phosphatase
MSVAIFLDRDGVINYDSQSYIKSPEEMHFIPGSLESIAYLTSRGVRLGVATNQSGVARGLYTEETLHAIHQKMLDAIVQAGGQVELVVYCPHLPIERCACRKPKPGLLLQLAQALDVPIEGIPFVGDRLSDVEAALLAGAKPILIRSSMTNAYRMQQYEDVPVFTSLQHYVDETFR